ncbi:MAG: DinB family protein [Anaerolineales bacterium]|nr:DinB family protein [Anaerolineales bacterium]MBX3038536.1 DinB family protein [Anaerolineales bacterium]
MTLTLLLDLDDTLLNTNLQSFVPAYFQALANELAPQITPTVMFRALIAGTQKMNESTDFTKTLREVFDEEFYPQIDVERGKLDSAIENFYDNIFPTLQNLTSPKEGAKEFVEWAFAQGFRIAIATDPLLPTKATHHRLRWAGFEPNQFEIVSTYENFHFSKTYPAYYAEVLGLMGWADNPILMVGNDLDRDIIPAKRLGLKTYLVDAEPASQSGLEADSAGSLSGLRLWLESIDLTSLTPNFKSKESISAIMSATPAVLNSLLKNLDSELWSRKPSDNDWTLTELICHLRDTEREIHHMQLKLFNEKEEPFIPRPDTGVWASQRDYMHENGLTALEEFNNARLETMRIFENKSESNWTQKARHAIFGPTNFLEVSGFMAEHDRLHIQQAYDTLKKL